MDGPDSEDQKQSTSDMTAFAQNLLLQMQSRFQAMSESIVSKIDEIGARIDELEQSIYDLKTEMGAESSSPLAPTKGKFEERDGGGNLSLICIASLIEISARKGARDLKFERAASSSADKKDGVVEGAFEAFNCGKEPIFTKDQKRPEEKTTTPTLFRLLEKDPDQEKNKMQQDNVFYASSYLADFPKSEALHFKFAKVAAAASAFLGPYKRQTLFDCVARRALNKFSPYDIRMRSDGWERTRYPTTAKSSRKIEKSANGRI
ncbi:hypothetical protein ACLOJK_040254 [Asimina triloba]